MQTNKIIEQIRALPDPIERWKAAEHFKDEYRGATFAIADVRRDIVNELLARGRSLAQVAEELGISKSRVQRLTLTREEITERRKDGQ